MDVEAITAISLLLAQDRKGLPIRARDVREQMLIGPAMAELQAAANAMAQGNVLETYNRVSRAWERATHDALLAYFGSDAAIQEWWEGRK